MLVSGGPSRLSQRCRKDAVACLSKRGHPQITFDDLLLDPGDLLGSVGHGSDPALARAHEPRISRNLRYASAAPRMSWKAVSINGLEAA